MAVEDGLDLVYAEQLSRFLQHAAKNPRGTVVEDGYLSRGCMNTLAWRCFADHLVLQNVPWFG